MFQGKHYSSVENMLDVLFVGILTTGIPYVCPGLAVQGLVPLVWEMLLNNKHQQATYLVLISPCYLGNSS